MQSEIEANGVDARRGGGNTAAVAAVDPSPVRETHVDGTRHNGTSCTRRSSSRLAPAFMVSAPGKVIVFGEHAVVHGKAAMAAAISLRSYLLVTTLSKSHGIVNLCFRDISLDHTWEIDSLPWSIFSHPSRRKRYFDLVTSLDPELVAAMQPHLEQVSPDKPAQERNIHRAAASAFLYLFMSLGDQDFPACTYTLRSTIPIGAGLGSSASISVCLATALLFQGRALSGPHSEQLSEEAEQQLECINRWAFVGEMIMHGNPSGVDNTVSTRGKAVIFKRTDYGKPPLVQSLKEFPELPLLLVDTCQAKSTAAEVAKVGQLKKALPAVVDHIMDAIDSITETAHSLITSSDFDPQDVDSLERLGQLISLNHALLNGLGVSHPKLERLRHLVDAAGVGWTKLTGSGGGGCAFTLLKPESAAMEDSLAPRPSTGTRRSALHELEAQLEQEGYEKYETTLGGDGVGVLWPAVLHTGEGEVGEEEIDHDKFVAAEGREGVEKLVGVSAGVQEGVREGWRFWRL